MKEFVTKDDLIDYIRPLGLAAILTDNICGCCLLESNIVKSLLIPLEDDMIKGIMVPLCKTCIPFLMNKEFNQEHLQKNALELIETGKGELIA